MTEAEFAAALASGADIVFDVGEGDASRTLPGAWIARALLRGTGVSIQNAIVAGAVELENVSLTVPVTLVNCRIDRFTARCCAFVAPVRVRRSSVRVLDVSGSRFEREFALQDAECRTLDVSSTIFEDRFVVDRSSIGRLLNAPGRYSYRRPFSYYLSPRYLVRVVRRRPRTVAVVASLVLHFFATLFVSRQHVQPAESVSTVQRLVFERKPAPTPRPIRRAPLVPHHVTVVRAAPVVRAPSPPRASVPSHLAPRHVAPPRPLRAPAHPQPKELAKIVPRSRPVAPQVLGDARIAQIENGLRSAIASDRGRLDPLAGTASAVAAPKHFSVDVASFSEGDRRHHGLCDPVKDWIEGDYDYYYVICNVRFSDGTFQRQGVPWPVRFPKSNDPFNGTAAGEKPLAMPLPGWRLGQGETVTPELREYARANGVDLDAAQ